MSRRVARPYAAAMYQVMERQGTDVLREVEQQLDLVAAVFRREPDLLRAFEVPAIPPVKKRELLDRLGEAASLRNETRRLLAALSQHYRLRFLDEVVHEFRRLVDDREGVVRGSVTLPVDPRPEHVGALADVLREALGAEIRLESKVEPELLAGFVVRLGSRVYDGSLRTQLARFAASETRQ